MNYLWGFHWNCGRQGVLEGLFVATEDEINDLIGQRVYFGEVLGKYSEIYGPIEEEEITKVGLDVETVEKITDVLGDTWSGYNPFDFVEEEND